MRHHRILFASLALLPLVNPGYSSGLNGQEMQQPARKTFGVVPAYRRCLPAEVKHIAMGGQPTGVLLAQVTVENRASKTITAVKLGWKVYQAGEGSQAALYPCDALAPAADVLESGTTLVTANDTKSPSPAAAS